MIKSRLNEAAQAKACGLSKRNTGRSEGFWPRMYKITFLGFILGSIPLAFTGKALAEGPSRADKTAL